jgi:hypothetical protein
VLVGRGQIGQPHRAIFTADDQLLAVGSNGDGGRTREQTRNLTNTFPGADIPDLGRTIVARRGHEFSIPGYSHSVDAAIVPFPLSDSQCTD